MVLATGLIELWAHQDSRKLNTYLQRSVYLVLDSGLLKELSKKLSRLYFHSVGDVEILLGWLDRGE